MKMSDSKLRRALNEFQQRLPPDQKHQLDAANLTPNPEDVISLLDEINIKYSSSIRRVLAGRMSPVLNSIQQYSTVIDTFAQINGIAALIWGSVKIVIRAGLNFVEYFDKLSKYFAQLGNYCPRLSEYKELFKDSIRLQNALSDFYAIVVKFCCYALELFSDKRIRAVAKYFQKTFKKDFQLLEENFIAAREEVNQEIQLASEEKIDRIYSLQLVEAEKNQHQHILYMNEIEENKIFRLQQKLTLAQNNELRDQSLIKDEERHKIRLVRRIWCYDYTWSFRKTLRTRCDNTGIWLLEKDEYLKWKNDNTPRCLWLSGIIGCGKTVLTGLAIERLSKTTRLDETKIVIYYFFDFIRKESMLTLTFLRSILHQLIDCLISIDKLDPSIQQSLEQLFVNSSGQIEPQVEELEKLVLECCARYKRVYFLIDGIDEADQVNKRYIFRFLKKIQLYCPSVKLFISGQLDTITMKAFGHNQVFSIKIKSQDLDSDIRVFTENQIEHERKFGVLINCLPELIGLIKQFLTSHAHGMFLWVDLQIKVIIDACEDQKFDDILDLLESLPQGIIETYSHMMQRLLDKKNGQLHTVVKICQWMALAQRPLSVGELEEAISITSEQKFWRQPREKLQPSLIGKMCVNLILVDEFDDTVLPAHHTVIPFLMSYTWRLPDSNFRISKDDPSLGETCITYLNFSDFQKSLKPTTDTKNLRYLNQTTSLIPHLFSSFSFVNSIGLNSFKSHKRASKCAEFDLENRFRTFMSSFNRVKVDPAFQLFEYCRTYWHCHCHSFKGKNESSHLILKRFITNAQLPFIWQPWDLPDDLDPFTNWPMFNWAVNKSHDAILSVWEDSVTIYEKAAAWKLLWSKDGDRLFSSACLAGDIDQIHKYLAYHKGMPLSFQLSESQLLDGLTKASGSGHLDVVELLLQMDFNIDAVSKMEKRTPMQAAAASGHLAVIKHLIRNGANFNTTRNNDNEYDALHAAVENGHSIIVDFLLNKGAKIRDNCILHKRETTIEAAAKNGHLSVVELLHQRGWNINSDNESAMQVAAENGHLAVVEFLFQHGTNITAWCNGTTALGAAIKNGHLTMIEYMFQQGTLIEESSLRTAARNGQLAVIEYLIQRGDRIDEWSLKAAIENGHLNVIEYMFQHGAEIDVFSLRIAAQNGHLAVVKYLFQRGAKIDELTLRTAAEKGHLAVVEYLIQRGAEIDEYSVKAAVKNGHLSVVKYLSQQGAKIDENLFRIAVIYGHLDVLKYLFQPGVKIDELLFAAAVETGHLAMIEYLLERGAKFDKRSLIAAIENGHLAIVEYLFQRGAKIDDFSFQRAIENGHLTIVKYLFRRGAKIGEHSLSAAAKNGHLDVVEYLIQRGAKIDPISLIVAVENGQLTVVERLLKQKGILNSRLCENALRLAIEGGRREMAETWRRLGVKERKNDRQSFA